MKITSFFWFRFEVSLLVAAAALSISTAAIVEPERGVSASSGRLDPQREVEGLASSDVPQFVVVAFDDNFAPDGMTWATDWLRELENPAGMGQAATFDGMPVRTTFFHNSTYLGAVGVLEAWRAADAEGHELGNHTVNHPNGRENGFGVAEWTTEISDCQNSLSGDTFGVGGEPTDIIGFRTPFLAHNDATFETLSQLGLVYDSSIQGCFGAQEDGTNCLFPYTLDAPSPDNLTLVEARGEPEISSHPGLWEFPVTALIIPPDELADEYDFSPGLRDRIPTSLAAPNYYDAASGKLSGLDITMMFDAVMLPSEVLATLKYNFDLHYAGNRAPLVFVAHTHVYTEDDRFTGTRDERRAALEEFFFYTLAHEATRIRPFEDLVAYFRAPRGLSGALPSRGSGEAGSGSGMGQGGALGGQGQKETDDELTAADGCQCHLGPSGAAPRAAWYPLFGLIVPAFLRRFRRRAQTAG